MKITELTAKLNKLLETHGDIEVVFDIFNTNTDAEWHVEDNPNIIGISNKVDVKMVGTFDPDIGRYKKGKRQTVVLIPDFIS